MKRILFLIMCLSLAFPSLFSQNGLAVAGLFDGSLKNNKNVVEVEVKGVSLKAFNLSTYRSLTATAVPTVSARMLQLVERDLRTASGKEVGQRGGRIYYAMLTFPGTKKGTYRYVFYRNKPAGKNSKQETTVVFMEGKATLRELKRMFE